jgi:restriction system protein
VLAYGAENKLLAIDYVLPDWSIVPEMKGFRYVKARDEIDKVAETAAKRRALYTSVVAQSALRVLHEVFEADRLGHVETVALNCMVDTIDRATGRRHVPCILSVRTTAGVFKAINLAAVDPAACLKGLAAAMSPSPADLAPVRPVLELKMVDPRFITEADVLSELDQRPNLMELTPGEFESLITNLFTKMGLEARQTQASRDGGVDCVAFDPRPIFGGKVVIQAKRYKNTVGVSAVRDLYGTIQNEGASKGILVTTSGYGAAAFQFAEGKPMELLSGANLLYLLAEHADMEARIVVPDEWRDPIGDTPADQPDGAGAPG